MDFKSFISSLSLSLFHTLFDYFYYNCWRSRYTLLLIVIVLVHALDIIRGEIADGNRWTATRFVILAALPVLLRAAQPVAVKAHVIDDQDLCGLVL